MGQPRRLRPIFQRKLVRLLLVECDTMIGQGKLGLALRLLPLDGQQAADTDSGPAALAGVQAGDVLLSVNGVPVKSIDQMRATLAKSQKPAALLILRGDSRIFYAGRPGLNSRLVA